MHTSFSEMVGTAAVASHCFDSDELTALTPALDSATAVHDMAAQAGEALAAGFTGTGVVHCSA